VYTALALVAGAVTPVWEIEMAPDAPEDVLHYI